MTEATPVWMQRKKKPAVQLLAASRRAVSLNYGHTLYRLFLLNFFMVYWHFIFSPQDRKHPVYLNAYPVTADAVVRT